MFRTHAVSSSFLSSAAIAAAVLLAASSLATAQAGPGVRAGVSGDPDQFFVGAHYDTGPLVDMLSFRPNAEVGFSNDLTTVAVNLEFAYRIPVRRNPWSFYAGGGPALNVYHFSFDDPSFNHTDLQPGFNLLFGVEHRRGLFAEFKLGLIDSPEVKFTVGYTFR